MSQGKLCLKGHCPCRGRVSGNGKEAGLRLPAKMDKRKEMLRAILGPAPKDGYPEELLRPPGKVAGGGLGDVRVSKAHFDENDLRIASASASGKVRVHRAGAKPRVPLAEVREAVHKQQERAEPSAEPADADEGLFRRPARGERQAQEDARTLINACEAALRAVEEHLESGEALEEDTASIIRGAL